MQDEVQTSIYIIYSFSLDTMLPHASYKRH